LLFDCILYKIIAYKLSLFRRIHSSHAPTLFSFMTDSSAEQSSYLSIAGNRWTMLVDSLKEVRSMISYTQGCDCETSLYLGVDTFPAVSIRKDLNRIGGNICAVIVPAGT
jgi:hypothetical protein